MHEIDSSKKRKTLCQAVFRIRDDFIRILDPAHFHSRSYRKRNDVRKFRNGPQRFLVFISRKQISISI
jgi:uncharacterized C2H2 Zn-finger protein